MLSKLSAKQKDELFIALNFLKMEELTEICRPREIPTDGKKGAIIERIKHFVNTGKILKTPPIPAISCAKASAPSLLKEDALILNGLYKNDEKTRAYMKKLVGDHFHFTAFGQDWIKEQWMSGKPPTYKEFATFWQKEYTRRQSKEYKANPKAEWAYLNFVQKYSTTAEKGKVAAAWEKERASKVEFVLSLLTPEASVGKKRTRTTAAGGAGHDTDEDEMTDSTSSSEGESDTSEDKGRKGAKRARVATAFLDSGKAAPPASTTTASHLK